LEKVVEKLRRMDGQDMQRVIFMREQEKARISTNSWSIMGFFKKLLGFVLMIVLMKQILLPGETNELAKFDDDMNVNPTESEIKMMNEKESVEERRAYFEKLREQRKKEFQENKKKEAEESQKRYQDYYEAKIKGKTAYDDLTMSLKDDFKAFAEKKGGVVKMVYNYVEEYVIEKVEQKIKQKKEEEGDESEEETQVEES
jgi:hypothetical protein